MVVSVGLMTFCGHSDRGERPVIAASSYLVRKPGLAAGGIVKPGLPERNAQGATSPCVAFTEHCCVPGTVLDASHIFSTTF